MGFYSRFGAASPATSCDEVLGEGDHVPTVSAGGLGDCFASEAAVEEEPRRLIARRYGSRPAVSQAVSGPTWIGLIA
jgi:hypothetical protein